MLSETIKTDKWTKSERQPEQRVRSSIATAVLAGYCNKPTQKGRECVSTVEVHI